MKRILFYLILILAFLMSNTVMANNLPDAEIYADEPYISYTEMDGVRIGKMLNIQGYFSHKMVDRVGGILKNSSGEIIDVADTLSDKNGAFTLTFVLNTTLQRGNYTVCLTSDNCFNTINKSVYLTPMGKEAKLYSFSIGGTSAYVSGNNVTIKLNSGADVRATVPIFSLYEGAEAYVDGDMQKSGQSVVDFSKGTVTYLIVSEDLTKKVKYNVTVEVPEVKGGSSQSGQSGSYIGKKTDSSREYVFPIALESSHIFSDLNGYEWAEKYIEELFKKGIVSGIGDGRFMPGRSVTREEYVKMIVSALGIEGEIELPFSDIPENHWAYKYVKSAYATGIIQGVSDESFGAGVSITRQDMALIAYRALLKTGKLKPAGNSNMKFADNDMISEYAKPAVEYMYSVGIINGVGGNCFAPLSDASRSEAAKIIYLISE